MTTRVLHLIKGLGPGGAENLLLNQARATSDIDLDFIVAYLISWKNHLVPALHDERWHTQCLHSERVWDLRWAFRLRRLIRQSQVQVVHGHSPLVAAVSRIVLRTLPRDDRPRSIYTEHNEWGRHNSWTRRLNRLTIGLEDHVIAVSEGVRQSMPASIDVEVLIHGIDVEAVAALAVHRQAVRQELEIEDNEIVIGIVANFRKEKAYELLLQAARTVIDTHANVRFVSVGQGPLEAEIRALHEQLKLGDRFLILGYRDDATRVMSGFDVFTLASRHEGLPVALMEAMALGLPVVATGVGGIPDAVHRSNSLLVPPGDSHELAAAHLEMAERVRQGKVQHATHSFDARTSAESLTDLYTKDLALLR